MRRVRAVAPRGRCRPADLRLAPAPIVSRSSTVIETSGSRAASSRAIRQPTTPAPIMAVAGRAIGLCSLELRVGWLGRPLDERAQLVLGPDAAQPVQDPLAAPGVEAQVGVSEAALAAGGILQENAALRRAIPLDSEIVINLVFIALSIQA